MKNDKVVHKGNYKGQFIYRGKKFDKSERTPNGYWGAYTIGNSCFSYRSEVLEYIDNKLA